MCDLSFMLGTMIVKFFEVLLPYYFLHLQFQPNLQSKCPPTHLRPSQQGLNNGVLLMHSSPSIRHFPASLASEIECE